MDWSEIRDKIYHVMIKALYSNSCIISQICSTSNGSRKIVLHLGVVSFHSFIAVRFSCSRRSILHCSPTHRCRTHNSLLHSIAITAKPQAYLSYWRTTQLCRYKNYAYTHYEAENVAFYFRLIVRSFLFPSTVVYTILTALCHSF